MSEDNVLRLNPAEPADHIRMMQMPDMWPLNGALALTRRIEVADEKGLVLAYERELGLMFAIDGVPRFTIFLVNLFDRRVVQAMRENTLAPLLGIEQIDYRTPEEILADDWRVD